MININNIFHLTKHWCFQKTYLFFESSLQKVTFSLAYLLKVSSMRTYDFYDTFISLSLLLLFLPVSIPLSQSGANQYDTEHKYKSDTTNNETQNFRF